MKISYIELLGQKHPLCYSLSAHEEITEAFGDSEKMRGRINDGDLKAVETLLEILMRAGRRYCTAVGEELPPEIKCRIADVIDMTDPESVRSVFAAISNGSAREVDTASAEKNAVPTPAES